MLRWGRKKKKRTTHLSTVQKWRSQWDQRCHLINLRPLLFAVIRQALLVLVFFSLALEALNIVRLWSLNFHCNHPFSTTFQRQPCRLRVSHKLSVITRGGGIKDKVANEILLHPISQGVRSFHIWSVRKGLNGSEDGAQTSFFMDGSVVRAAVFDPSATKKKSNSTFYRCFVYDFCPLTVGQGSFAYMTFVDANLLQLKLQLLLLCNLLGFCSSCFLKRQKNFRTVPARRPKQCQY